MLAEVPERVVGLSGEVALWRAVIDQALQDAVAAKRIMRYGRPTFADLERNKARNWFWRASADFGFVCDCADLDESAVASYAQDVIHGGVGVAVRAGPPVEAQWPGLRALIRL